MVFIFLVLLLLINIWVFVPFFNLGLFGDDWLAIFRYSYYLDEPKHLGPYSTEYFNHFKYFLNAYGSQDIIMAFLYKTFGEYSSIYFILSYILRVGAGFSIYFPAFYLTKSRVASWFAVFFFLFSAIGLEASNWVFNMPSYLAITFFSLLTFFYLKFHNKKKIKYLALSYLFFTLTFISTPIRAHGLIPFIIFIETVFAFSQKSWEYLKFSLIRVFGFLLIFLLIFLLGFKETISGNSLNAFVDGLNSILFLLSHNRFDFLFYPIATLGNMIVPESFIPHGLQITSLSQYLFKIFLPIFFIYMILILILTHHINNLSRKFFPAVALGGVFWTLIVFMIYKVNPATFSNPAYMSSLLIGGYFLIVVLIMSSYLKTNNIIKGGLLIALGWTIISYLYPWWQTNTSAIFATTHRYLIISNTGISLLLAIIISIGKNMKSILTLLTIGTIFLIMHAFFTRSFLEEQHKTHNRTIVKKIWSAMPTIAEVGKSTEPLIFYFEGDGTNSSIIEDSITFGFPPHMAIIYGITEENLIPIPMSNWKEVVSAIIDGKSLTYHGRPQKPISPQRIYAFRLQGKDNLVDITDLARTKLKEISVNKESSP